MLKKITLYCVACWVAALPVSAQTLKETLPNGLKVIIREDHRAPVATTQLWYRVGSVDEKIGKTGLSHALEHMMFKGTRKVPSGEFAQRISAMGGSNNAYTSANETVYHATVAKQYLPEVLALEADRMHNLNFSNKDFINEMKVIREERRQSVDDNPMGSMFEQLNLRAFDKPFNRAAVIGYMHDLHRLKANDLRQWYRQWYAPNNATLVVVGDVDAHDTLNTIKRTFGSIPARTLPARHQLSETEIKKATSAHTTGNTKQPIFILAYRVPHLHSLNDKLPYALDLLTLILDGHSSARFDKHLVRGKQLALETGVHYELVERRPQLWKISAMPNENVDVATLRAAIEAQIADIAANGVSEEELKRAKTLEQSATIYHRDSIENQASLIGTLESNGFHYQDEEHINQRLQSLTSADIQAAAQLLTDKRREIFIQLNPRPQQH